MERRRRKAVARLILAGVAGLCALGSACRVPRQEDRGESLVPIQREERGRYGLKVYSEYTRLGGAPVLHGPYAVFRVVKGERVLHTSGDYSHGERNGLWVRNDGLKIETICYAAGKITLIRTYTRDMRLVSELTGPLEPGNEDTHGTYWRLDAGMSPAGQVIKTSEILNIQRGQIVEITPYPIDRGSSATDEGALIKPEQ